MMNRYLGEILLGGLFYGLGSPQVPDTGGHAQKHNGFFLFR